jgi:hypothetical protein
MAIRRPKSSTSTLLILSAIDMLTASLVCAVVLFVVLVGAEGDASPQQSSAEQFSAPSVVFIYSHGTSAAIKGRAPAPKASTSRPDPYLAAVFGAAPYASQRYEIPAGQHEIEIETIDAPIAVEIFPGTGRSILILAECHRIDIPLVVAIGEQVEVRGACAAADRTQVNYPDKTSLSFAVPSGTPLPQFENESWTLATSGIDADGEQTWTATKLKPVATAVPDGPALIARVLL